MVVLPSHAVGVTGLWLVGSKRSIGFVIGLFAQALWFTYAVVTEQYGFIVACAAYGSVHARGLYRWTRSDQALCPDCGLAAHPHRTHYNGRPR